MGALRRILECQIACSREPRAAGAEGGCRVHCDPQALPLLHKHGFNLMHSRNSSFLLLRLMRGPTPCQSSTVGRSGQPAMVMSLVSRMGVEGQSEGGMEMLARTTMFSVGCGQERGRAE